MNVLELKVVLHRANPAVVRQFTIPDDFSMDFLQQVMSVLFGWNPDTKWLICAEEINSLRNPETLKGKDKRSAANTMDDIVEIKNVLKTGHILCLYPIISKSFVFRISFIGEKEQTNAYPLITRYRGYNIPFDIKNLEGFNRLQLWWKNRSYTYYIGDFYRYDQQKYYFIKKDTERELRKLVFAKDGKEFSSVLNKLNYSNSIRISHLIEQFRVQDIRNIAQKENIYIPSGLKRDGIMDYVSTGLGSSDVFENHIKYMSLSQYDVFQRICTGNYKSADSDILYDVGQDLHESSLADFYYYGFRKEREIAVTPSTELLQNYEEWLLDGNEKDFLKEAKIYSSILGCVRLYGFIRRSEWIKLSSLWVSEELSYLNMSADDAWNNYFMHIKNSELILVGSYETDYLYDKTYLDENIMSGCIGDFAAVTKYEPDFKQLARIEAYGLYFEDEDRKTLENFIKKNARFYGYEEENAHIAEEIGRDVYHSLRCNIDIDFIVSDFIESTHINNQRVIGEFKKLAVSLHSKVRQIEYGGYTKEEYFALRKNINKSSAAQKQTAATKVYPNDPCPCGSGKKYKNCHGVRK